ncbi:hypothetical protein [Brevibacterium samyangense]|uniref:Aminoglycoside phosphotransferase domain-containing protein n=1 Tax=Brevibacterium samyangense TaxID=366888 RepID=A0ABN2TKH2_9MICO
MRRLCLRIPLLARLLWPDSVVGAAVHAAPVEVTRRMLPSGSGSLEVVRVTTVLRDGSRRDHVEKVLAPTSAEHDFWTTGLGKDLVREGERFTVVAPTRIRDSTAGRTLEFSFVSECVEELGRREAVFDARLLDTVRAVAEFNGRNRVDARLPQAWPPRRAPSVEDLARTFRVPGGAALALRRRWDRGFAAWTRTRDALLDAPMTVAHNDLHFHNVVHRGGRTILLDLGIADASPVGAELHTVLRHMRVAGADEATIDGMFREYLAVIRDFVPEADEVRVRAAAEVRYFARFTDTGLASGRSRFSFESAMAGIARAADLVGEPRAGEE